MDEVIKKLQSLKTEFDSVAGNARYKHSDEVAQTLGDTMISERFSEKLENIINELQRNIGRNQ